MTAAEHKALQSFIELSTLPEERSVVPTVRILANENTANGNVVPNGVKPTQNQLLLGNTQETQVVVTLDTTNDKEGWSFGTSFVRASPGVKISQAPSYLLGKPIHDFDASMRQNVSTSSLHCSVILCSQSSVIFLG